MDGTPQSKLQVLTVKCVCVCNEKNSLQQLSLSRPPKVTLGPSASVTDSTGRKTVPGGPNQTSGPWQKWEGVSVLTVERPGRALVKEVQ